MASGSKQYGLILPSKSGKVKGSTVSRANVFGEDSDSETESGGDWVKNSLKRDVAKGVQKQTVKTQVKKALEQDPTVFQYDEIYEDLEKNKADLKAVSKIAEKKPRYIQALLQTAERRKKENERRIERQVQKEREEEGTQFADKESFVTASYRAKLEEFKKQEEEEKRMERLEAIADVTKQKDLTGFYRHIYRQTMGESLASSQSGNGGSEAEEKITNESSVVKMKTDRQYRKRRSSSSHSDESDQDSCGKRGENMDADSDLSSSSSSSTSGSESSCMESGSEEGEITKKKKKLEHASDTNLITSTGKDSSLVDDIKDDVHYKEQNTKENVSIEDITENDTKKLSISNEMNLSQDVQNALQEDGIICKPKVCIWSKRTIGQAYEDAVKRYFERKAARSAGRA